MKDKRLLLVGSICLILVLAAMPFMAACPAPAPSGEIATTQPEEDGSAPEEPEFVFNGQSCYSPADAMHRNFLHQCMMIEKYSDNRIKIVTHAGGEIVGPIDTWDAISEGVLDVGFVPHAYTVGKSVALGIYCASHFGPSITQFIGWLYDGGGLDLNRQLVRKYFNIRVFPTMLCSKVFLHSNKRINNMDDILILKMRMSGLDAMLMKEFGVNPIMLAGSEVVPSLQKGVIDACSFSSMDYAQTTGFLEILKYHYFIQGHFVSHNLFAMNQDVWDKLPDDLKKVIDDATYDNLMWHETFVIQQNMKAMKEAEEVYGGEVLFFPDEVNDALKAAKERWYAKMVEEDPEFALVVDSMNAYMEEWGRYGDLVDAAR